MAQRRMFSKSITNSSQFLMMHQSSQNLYFHFGMNADDDGFCEHFPLMRMTDSKPDDLKVLQAKGFVNVFDEKVLIITDWKENNYLRSDRYTPSKYLEIYKEEIKRLSSGIPSGDTGKVRLGKVRLEEDINTVEQAPQEIPLLIKSFEEVNPAVKRMYGNKTQRQACKDLIETYGFDRVLNVIKNTLPRTNKMTAEFFPNIGTPLQLFDKWQKLEDAIFAYRAKKQIKNNNVFW